MQRTFQHWIATKWLEMDQNNLHMKFSAFSIDFSSLSPDPLGSRRPAQAGVKDSYPLKSGYFTEIIACSVKTVADRYIHAAYHNKHWWQAFWIYQHRWPWTTLNPSKRHAFQEWIAPKWLEIDQENLRTNFSAWNVDFSSPSPDALDSSRPVHVSVNERYPCIKWLFILCWLV